MENSTSSAEKETYKETLVIAGRTYPLVVDADERKLLSQIEHSINEKIRDLQSTYKEIDVRDCLAMMLIANELQDQTTADTLDQRLTHINARLEDQL